MSETKRKTLKYKCQFCPKRHATMRDCHVRSKCGVASRQPKPDVAEAIYQRLFVMDSGGVPGVTLAKRVQWADEGMYKSGLVRRSIPEETKAAIREVLAKGGA